MKMIVVCIRDNALGAYLRPFTVPAAGVAVRGFTDEINRADGEMHKHPNDYDLYRLGSWDDETGFFENEPAPVLISRGQDIYSGD